MVNNSQYNDSETLSNLTSVSESNNGMIGYEYNPIYYDNGYLRSCTGTTWAFNKEDLNYNTTNCSAVNGNFYVLRSTNTSNNRTIGILQAAFTRKVTISSDNLGTTLPIGTISTYMPMISTPLTLYLSVTGSAIGYAYVSTEGVIYIKITNVAGNPTYFYVTGIWYIIE